MKKNCPNIQCNFFGNNQTIVKKGSFFRKCDSRSVQRFSCRECGENFSAATGSLEFRHKKRREVPMILHLLSSGVSMRRTAKILKLHRTTIQRKMILLSEKAKLNHQIFLNTLKSEPVTHLQFDDLITIEHTKLKPLSISMAIDAKTRKFLDVQVSQIPAFGHLAEKSVKKYGRRKSRHKEGLRELFKTIKDVVAEMALIESDEHKLYPSFVKDYFPHSSHKRYKGGRGCVAGQGELKRLHYDPLFTLNHNFAMLRANINRLIRKTWCTTKDPSMLQRHLLIYINYHNTFLLN